MKLRLLTGLALLLATIVLCLFGISLRQEARLHASLSELGKEFAVNKTNTLDVLQEKYREQEKQIETAQIQLDSLRRKYKIKDVFPHELQPKRWWQLNQRSYWDKKRELAAMINCHKLVQALIETKKIDLQLPKRNSGQ